MAVSAEASQSITRLIRAVQDGSSSAVRPLLSAYFDRLVRLASKRLRNLPGLGGYDEDLALRSFHSVYQRLRDPARPLDLAGRDDLWRLLATRTISRAIDLIRRHRPAEVPGDAGCHAVTDPRADTRGGRRAGRRVPAPAGLAPGARAAANRPLESRRLHPRGDRGPAGLRAAHHRA